MPAPPCFSLQWKTCRIVHVVLLEQLWGITLWDGVSLQTSSCRVLHPVTLEMSHPSHRNCQSELIQREAVSTPHLLQGLLSATGIPRTLVTATPLWRVPTTLMDKRMVLFDMSLAPSPRASPSVSICFAVFVRKPCQTGQAEKSMVCVLLRYNASLLGLTRLHFPEDHNLRNTAQGKEHRLLDRAQDCDLGAFSSILFSTY